MTDLRVLQCIFSRRLGAATWHVYQRMHKGASVEGEEKRTLFVTNFPSKVTEAHLSELYGKFGKVEKVTTSYIKSIPFLSEFESRSVDLPMERQQRYAHVTFENSESAVTALECKKIEFPIEPEKKKAPKDDLFESNETIKQWAEKTIQEYDAREKQPKAQAEEGWRLIVGKGRTRRVIVDPLTGETKAVEERPKKRKTIEMDVYSFQKKERKMKVLQEIRQQQSKDRERIKRMKGERKFRPK